MTLFRQLTLSRQDAMKIFSTLCGDGWQNLVETVPVGNALCRCNSHSHVLDPGCRAVADSSSKPDAPPKLVR